MGRTAAVSGVVRPALVIDSAHEAAKSPFELAELATFAITIERVLDELTRAENYPLEPGITEILRVRIAAAVFDCADRGERDPNRMKQLVTTQFLKPAGYQSPAS